MTQLNYFSEAEQGSQQQFKSWRDRWLAPLCKLLTACGITPNILSGLGLLVLLPFVWILVAVPEPVAVQWGLPFLLIHLLLDGVDGPLARMQGKAGAAGSLVDMVCDHLGMVIVATTLIQAQYLLGTLGCLYVFFYTTSVVFVIVLNQLGQPLRWVIRSKYVLYALVGVLGVAGWNWLNTGVACFVVSDVVFTVLGFRKLYRLLLSQESESSESGSLEL